MAWNPLYPFQSRIEKTIRESMKTRPERDLLHTISQPPLSFLEAGEILSSKHKARWEVSFGNFSAVGRKEPASGSLNLLCTGSVPECLGGQKSSQRAFGAELEHSSAVAGHRYWQQELYLLLGWEEKLMKYPSTRCVSLGLAGEILSKRRPENKKGWKWIQG